MVVSLIFKILQKSIIIIEIFRKIVQKSIYFAFLVKIKIDPAENPLGLFGVFIFINKYKN